MVAAGLSEAALSEAGLGRIEHESVITGETYRLLAAMRDPNTEIVRKRRYCLVENGQHFEIDHLTEPVDVWLLEAELVTATDTVTLPEVLCVDREVTDDPGWRNRALAAAPNSWTPKS